MILVPEGLERRPCWTTVWLGPWSRKEQRLHQSPKAPQTVTISQAPPWRFGSEAGKVGCSEASRCLSKAPEPGRGLSTPPSPLVCLFVFVCLGRGTLTAWDSAMGDLELTLRLPFLVLGLQACVCLFVCLLFLSTQILSGTLSHYKVKRKYSFASVLLLKVLQKTH